ncbi:phosphomannomutase/phosphoglucomutase [Candidatus Actinomarina]|nr:phosphomannomutase/phosphoglucomutase [Candidatus Actinomarina sp.]
MAKNKLDLIFKSYDIRGVYGDTLTEEVAFKIGYAFANFVEDDSILIGHDGRISYQEMFDAISSGIISANKNIIYIGLVPTDIIYSLSGLLNKPGLIITASHNPKNYNGLKLCNAGALPIGENTGLLEIKALVENFNNSIEINNLKIVTSNLIDNYFDHIKALVQPNMINNKLKFGIDGGNGAIGSVFDDLDTIYSFNYSPIYLEVDGNFPNHPADPSDEKNLEDLKNLVLENNLDFGVAFDGDADRAVFIDDKGNVISGSMMTALISDFLSKEKNNLKVVHNVNVSPHALELLNDRNIQLFRCKVGHSNIKKMMREIDADFGGEHSAHFYYKENFYADSGILTLLIFMKIISTKEDKVSNIFENYNFPPSSGEVNFVVDDVEESLKNVEKVFDVDFDYLDGLTCTTENYWFNIRGSNTEPKLRVNVESRFAKVITEVLEKISSNI